MNLPIKDPVLIPTNSHQERAVAIAAAFSLSTLVEDHNEQTRTTRQTEHEREAEEPFLWGQDFDIEPEIWEQYDYEDLIRDIYSQGYLSDLRDL